MWPLNLPARDLLKLPGSAWIAWAIFDAVWYRATYAGATAHLAGAEAGDVLGFYLEFGQVAGHSPNYLFDEAWHRQAYPEVAAQIHAGQVSSAFDAYCRGGCLTRSPNWLFEETVYRERYPDLTDEILRERGLVNGYDHYLWRGGWEGRIGHRLFDAATYLSSLDPTMTADARATGPFPHYLAHSTHPGSEVQTSRLFDPVWYRTRYPEVANAIHEGRWTSALQHYLCNDTPLAFDPSPAFSEAAYLEQEPEVAARVERGEFRNSFAHFLTTSSALAQSPADDCDLWAAAKIISQRRATLLSALFGRTPLEFGSNGSPLLSVILVLRDRFSRTMMTLGSLRANYSGEIDLILVDAGSTDETVHLAHYVRGAKYLRFDMNLDGVRARNAALQFATAPTVLYLSPGIEPGPGAIAAALRRLQDEPTIGMVGGMILGPDAVLREAGNIIWRDGSTQPYLRDSPSTAPEANFVRDVDFCSIDFLAGRRDLLNELEGFDEAFASGGWADADLCLRVAQAGHRVVYDPTIVVQDLEAVELATHEPVDRGIRVFQQKHAAYLLQRPDRHERLEAFARIAGTSSRRALFLEDTIPLRIPVTGEVRSNDLVREITCMGYYVTVYPLTPNRSDLPSIFANMSDRVEVMHDRAPGDLEAFLQQRWDYYDVIWIAGTLGLDRICLVLQRLIAASAQQPRIILDTKTIRAIRTFRRTRLEGKDFGLETALREELRNVAVCDQIITVTDSEATLLADQGFGPVSVVGHMHPVHPTERPFLRREGMLFVGNGLRSSNDDDGLLWFVDTVLPLVEQVLGWRTRLTVVGWAGPEVDIARLRNHPRVTWRGSVADLEPLYDSHKVLVAPTLFAASLPYPVYEAAAAGLPAVVTDLLRDEVGWDDGQALLSADPADPASFAREVIAAHQDELLWQSLRDGGLHRVQRDNNRDHFIAALSRVLGSD